MSQNHDFTPEQLLAVEGPEQWLATWHQMLAEDDTEFDPELVAAFAEGRLTGADAQRAQQIVMANPSAREVYLTARELLAQDTRESQPLKLTPHSAATAAAVPPVPLATAMTAREPAKQSARFRFAGLSTAAAAILLLVTGFWGANQQAARFDLQQKVTALSQQIVGLQQSSANVAVTGAKFLALSQEAGNRAEYLAGRLNGMVLQRVLQSQATGRGLSDAVEQDAADSLDRTWQEAIREMRNVGIDESVVQVEEFYRMLSLESLTASGQLQTDADVDAHFAGSADALAALETQFAGGPVARNCDAVRKIVVSVWLLPADRDALIAEAAATLMQLAEGDEPLPEAVLNLALLQLRRSGQDVAEPWFQKYLEIVEDEDLRRPVREFLGK